MWGQGGRCTCGGPIIVFLFSCTCFCNDLCLHIHAWQIRGEVLHHLGTPSFFKIAWLLNQRTAT